ncbi:uncharacterized protein EV420DRAFT_1574401 [Desarmillaria tabescens]|uniref:Uncharacterized protein n=1 Tax=Armillaria tabescens TaxID=1929756 RepID=A0AA39MSM6_ARMTA|nr:uncharacterized protein EV420DRAFT_1574401 [Desarmillaria tabescens]KAK0444544.1 hypothetical protein EV420DRAFT_1574401 [Desarmillaria tabescens]
MPSLPTLSHEIDSIHVCILFSNPLMDTLYLALSILFDSYSNHRIIPTTLLLQRIQRDGTLYFGVILTGNALWMLFALCGRVSRSVTNNIHLRCRRLISPV